MLILLTGPSGAGKTSVILAGHSHQLWDVVPTWTTRPRRETLAADSKVSISVQAASKLTVQSQDYISSEYLGFSYINKRDDLSQAAACDSRFVSIVDWVHPYPVNLSSLGVSALGVVLLPSVAELRRRLAHEGRTQRLQSAIRDHERILRHESTYPAGWIVYRDDPAVQSAAHAIHALAQGQGKAHHLNQAP